MEVMNYHLVSMKFKGDFKAVFPVVLKGLLRAGSGRYSGVVAIWCRHGN